MSRTLNFAQHLWDMGQNLQKLGQADKAFRLFDRLASLTELPDDISEDASLRLAEMHLEAGRYKKARRKLAAFLTIRPDHAQAHYLMSCACEEDDTCAPERALKHYRRCAKLDPDNAGYWCDLGEFALYLGDKAQGLRALRRAGKLAADDSTILGQVAKGLLAEGETEEASKLLRTAMFRNSQDKRFREVWAQHQLQILHNKQQKAKQTWYVTTPGSMILPFNRPTPQKTLSGGKRVRHDGPSGLPGPKMPRRSRLADKKQM